MADTLLTQSGSGNPERIKLDSRYLEAQLALQNETTEQLQSTADDLVKYVNTASTAAAINIPEFTKELHRLTKQFRDSFYDNFMNKQGEIMEIKAEAELTALTKARVSPAVRDAMAEAWARIRVEEAAKLPKRDWGDSIGIANRIKSVEDSMNKVVIGIVQDGVARGRSVEEITKSIQQYVKPFPGYRDRPPKYYAGVRAKVRYGSAEYNALRIARTESARTYREIHMSYYDKFKFVTGYQWVLSNRHRGIDVCDSYAGKIFKHEDLPSTHPNCLCDILTVIDREKAYNLSASQVKELFK